MSGPHQPRDGSPRASIYPISSHYQDDETPYEEGEPVISTYWNQPIPSSYRDDEDYDSGGSPIDPATLQFALPPQIDQHIPKSVPISQYRPHHDPRPHIHSQSITTAAPVALPSQPSLTRRPVPLQQTSSCGSYSNDEPASAGFSDSDHVPLTASAQPISGTDALEAPSSDLQPRSSFQTVSDLGGSEGGESRYLNPRIARDIEQGRLSHQSRHGMSLMPGDYRLSRSPSTSGALYRAGSMVRAMSQRVVMISGEGESLEQQQVRRNRPRSSSADGRGRLSQLPGEPHTSVLPGTSYHYSVFTPPLEKLQSEPFRYQGAPHRTPMLNPLKGKSLGIFGPENIIRKKLCDFLVLPFTEPIIALLIILQLVLLAVDAGSDVFTQIEDLQTWGSVIDWALTGLFVIFTFELIARIIVSGFILNAAEYSTIDRKKGVRAAVADQYKAIFQPERQKSVKANNPKQFEPSPLARSFTMMQGQSLPKTVEEQLRYQLARRAFMRHSFNRLDFVAVVSFWASFFVGMTGLDKKHHINIFQMLSCLRILRLLALTNGTSIILRSLKKSAPLLIRVSFLIGFFWLVFAIIGVQSFKSSLQRQCVWIDPTDPLNFDNTFTNKFQFCGGHLDNETGVTMPWVHLVPQRDLGGQVNGTTSGKGFICPRGSICLQQDNPYNGTVNFDDILHSLELVFVIMSANTFSDIMYYTTNSDFLPAALFFGAGIMIMMLWLTNLLIAVITSSFQVIREESKGSAFTGEGDSISVVPGFDSQLTKHIGRIEKLYKKTAGLWVLLIAVDLFFQAFRSSRMSAERKRLIDNVELVVTIALDIEIFIRFAAHLRKFFVDRRNLFDLLLALITTLILIPPIRNSGTPYAWLTFFQIVRVYRVVLAVPMTRKLILLVLGNAAGIGNLMLFVFLITFLMSIFAVQLFRGEIPEEMDGEPNRITFNTIFNAFLGMYQVLSSENWTEILYTVTASVDSRHTSWMGAIFLIGWFILSFFILINMFIAVIQENFDVSEDEKRIEQVKLFLRRKDPGKQTGNLALSSIFTLGKSRKTKDPLSYGPAMIEMLLKDAVFKDFLNDQIDPLQEGSGTPSPLTHSGDVKPGAWSSFWSRLVSLVGKDPNPFYSNIGFDVNSDGMDAREMAKQTVTANQARRRAQREYLLQHPNYNTSLFVFKPKNFIRRICQKLVGPGRGIERIDGVLPNKMAWHTFSFFIYAAIVAMVVLACVTTPRYQRQYQLDHGEIGLTTWFVWTDVAFGVVFTIEAAIKVIADGFFWTPNAYYRSSWGIIDGIVLVTLWINVITLVASQTTVSRAVGAFKALRALRLLNVSESAKATLHSLIIGVWKILSAAFVSISLLIPFAIYGVNLFMGKMVACNDNSEGIIALVQCYGEYGSIPFSDEWEVLAPRLASNDYFSFDDFGTALFTLFQIVSQEGWTDVSFAAQSVTDWGLQPQFQNSQWNAVFFIVFNLLATVFILTLFISVFMRNYTEQTGVAFLTAEQRSWLELRKLLRQISPSRSSYDDGKSKLKKWCHKRAIEKRGKWYLTITVILVLHLVLLLLEFHPEPRWWTNTREYFFLGFIFIYIANVLIRIIGLGWTRCRRSSWDMYSLVAVIGAFATSVMLRTNPDFDTYSQLHKLFLVAIVGLLIPRNDALDQLFKTAAASFTTIANLLATWIVFFLVFAIALTQSFSLTRFGPNEDNNINFRTVPNALIVLFRMSCGEGWNQLMEDFADIEPPLCVETPGNFFESDCGSVSWARFLFVLWNIISMYIFVSLFVSLIYESFSYVYQRHSGLAAVDRVEIRRFKEAWRSVDPDGTGFISKEQFPRLLGELSGVFEMRIYSHEDSVHQILDDVRDDSMVSRHIIAHRHMSSTTTSAYGGISIDKLNKRLSQIEVVKVRERRRRFNIFYEEVMVAADPDKGISFTTVLMILAHYNIINDNKSLRLEEFLKRRARLQRVEEEVRRRVVKGFFQTLYWKRHFQKHVELKNLARMTGAPQLGVPDILMDDNSLTGRGQDDPPTNTATNNKNHHQSWSSRLYQHPLGIPRSEKMQLPCRQPSSILSFELQNSDGGCGLVTSDQTLSSGHDTSMPAPNISQSSKQGIKSKISSSESNGFSPSQLRDALDESVWIESIRRSTTFRRAAD